jgi:hypothetical protein
MALLMSCASIDERIERRRQPDVRPTSP